MYKIIITLLVAATALMFSTLSSANLTIDRMIIYFDANQHPRQDVVVTNTEQDTLYLQTEVYEVHNPGTEREELIEITNPNQIKLLATPNRAIVPPGGRKTVRLVSLEPPKDKELVYRVTFKPVPPNFTATQSAIKLLIAYQALVFVQPDNPQYHVKGEREASSMIFTNEGNVNVVMRNGQYCTNNNEESCTPLEQGTRLYAGAEWKIELPEAARSGKGFLQFGLFDGEQEKTQRFQL